MTQRQTVRISSPEGIIYQQEAYSVNAQTIDTGVTILPHHVPYMTVVSRGIVEVKDSLEASESDYIALSGGILEVNNNQTSIVCNYAVHAKSPEEGKLLLDKQEAEVEAAQALSRDDTVAYQRAQVNIKRALNQLDAGQTKGF
ncbi:ATP synthase F1 subunit epsilon [Hutsoniella sourekii]